MLSHLKRELKDLLGRNKPTEVFRRLRTEVLEEESEIYNEVVLVESSYNAGDKDGKLGLIDIDRQKVSFNSITQALLWVIDKIEVADLKLSLRQKEKNHVYIPAHHTLTCDRVVQSELVQLHYYENMEERVRHFYLHGDLRQSIKSLHKRLGHELGGHTLNWRDQDYEPQEQIAFIQCKPANHRIAKLFLINLYKDLLAQFKFKGEKSRNISKLKLSEVYSKSFRLQKPDTGEPFGADDFVFVLITLDHFNWNDKVTPEVVKDFITGFCQCELPEDAPSFFFFYGIEYSKENTQVQAAVQQYIEQSEYGEKLPLLTPVSLQDVAEWFSRYDELLPQRISPEQMASRHFGNQEAIDMVDVELKLQELTDRHNKGLLPDF